MRKPLKGLTAVALAAVLAVGLSACDDFPIDVPTQLPTQLPDISLPPIPSLDPQPRTTVTVTADPQPAPVVTETVTGDPVPAPAVTHTVTVSPDASAPAEVTVNVTSTVTATPEPSVSPGVTVTFTPGPQDMPPVSATPGTAPWWMQLLLGVMIAALLLLWWTTAAARNKGKRRLAASREQLAWAEGELAPHVLSQPTAAQVQAAWEVSRPDVMEIDRELYNQSTTLSTQWLRSRAAQGRVVLGELIAALDAAASPDAPTDADAVRAANAQIDAARSHVRLWLAASPV